MWCGRCGSKRRRDAVDGGQAVQTGLNSRMPWFGRFETKGSAFRVCLSAFGTLVVEAHSDVAQSAGRPSGRAGQPDPHRSFAIDNPSAFARSLVDSSLRVSALAIAFSAMPFFASVWSFCTSSGRHGWRWRSKRSVIRQHSDCAPNRHAGQNRQSGSVLWIARRIVGHDPGMHRRSQGGAQLAASTGARAMLAGNRGIRVIPGRCRDEEEA